MSNILEAQDYKNIIGLVEALPKSYTSTTKNGYKMISRLYDCAIESKLSGFSNFNDYTKLQKLVEGSVNLSWDSNSNDYSKLPQLDLNDIKHDIARITYGINLNVKEIKTLHKYLLKNKGFDLFEHIQEGYMQDLTKNMQFHVLDLFTTVLSDGLIEMKEFNKPLWKRLIEYNAPRGEKYVAKDMLELFTQVIIKNKTENYLENDWLLENINKFFNSQKTINKTTVKKLETFLEEFKHIDILGHQISPFLSKYLDNSSPIKELKPEAYHWEVDLNHLSMTQSVSVKLLKDNLDIAINTLTAEKHKIPGVINLHNARSKNIISLFVLYKEEKPIDDIRRFLALIVNASKEKRILDADEGKAMWSAIKLHNILTDNLEEKPQSPKARKI